ncbi:MAG: ATP-dependent zinc metalloprotease FtsH [Clostridia bacterium]|nr:ATP-dependent zinc metalloprotease FtsH [Clostridia bacterium]
MNLNKVVRSLIVYILIFILVISVTNFFSAQRQQAVEISYDRFYRYVQEEQVQSVRISGDRVNGVLRDGTAFVTVIPAQNEALLNQMAEKGVRVELEPPPETPWWTAILTTLLPVLFVIGAFFFIMQQTQGGGNRVMQFGRSRARLHQDDPKRRVTFADVAGIDEVKEELAEVVDFLKHPKRYLELGARIPKGILLFGPPGTGKTLMARAVAGEAGVPFFSISGSDFVEMFVGVGASRVRDLFETAKKNAPCIVFIDEIDAVGRQRGAGYGGGHDEREQTLNQLLVEMDGFNVNEGIIVMAATNRPDVLDPALLRPGRFDRQIVIDKPDLRAREEILKVHARGKRLEPDVDLSVIARRTAGFTGADLENVLNEAALLAARRRRKAIGMVEIEDAIDRILAGGPEKKNRIMNERERERVAYHEAGHALVSKLLPNTDPVHKISIIPRGGALGYTLQLPLEDRYLITKSEIEDRIAVLLAGRAAEELVYGEVTTGAQDDLERATKMARRMITEFGMSEELGPMTFGNRQDNPFLGRDLARDRNYSEEVAAAIDREVSHVITTLYQKSLNLLRANRNKLERLARRLVEKETIEGGELEEVLASQEIAI